MLKFLMFEYKFLSFISLLFNYLAIYSAITDYIFFEKLPFFGLTSYTRKVLLLNTSLKYLVYIAAPYRISLQNRGCFEGVKCEGSSFPSSGI